MPYLVTPVVPAGRMRDREQPVVPGPGGLVLRPWEAGDAPVVLEAYGVAECTYWVLPAARGRGVATGATLAMAHWALHDLGLHRLELQHSTANPASCRVAAKAGFGLEGTRRSAMRHPDGWHDMHLHARLPGDPQAAPDPGAAGP
jgi:RimJ/RimL family protein N-acetyltransferase